MAPHSRPNLWKMILFCSLTMSLGWGLRGTIGGGPVGAMIPGVMIGLALAIALGRTADLPVLLVLGTVGVALGGQMTYGQTIGFTRDPRTLAWGLMAMGIKGGVWGLTGGTLLGLGFVRRRYRTEELIWGLVIMLIVTTLGWKLLDEPKIFYLSNRLDKPREEIWIGLLMGGIALQTYLFSLSRETVSLQFAVWGLLCGAIGFGGGGIFFPLDEQWLRPYKIEAWKSMEFFFGLVLGGGYACAAYLSRDQIHSTENDLADTPDAFEKAHVLILWLIPCLIPLAGIWMQFSIEFRAMFSLTGSLLIIAALGSPRMAWHIAVSMTITAFLRDYAYELSDQKIIPVDLVGWPLVFLMSLPVVLLVQILPKKSPKTPLLLLLLVAWLGLIAALDKFHVLGQLSHRFVVYVFLAEGFLVSLLALEFLRKQRLIRQLRERTP